jgi:hypothetical protein
MDALGLIVPAISAERAGSEKLFRLHSRPTFIIASEEMKELFEKSQLTGALFHSLVTT